MGGEGERSALTERINHPEKAGARSARACNLAKPSFHQKAKKTWKTLISTVL
jgi:hypothetical protein